MSLAILLSWSLVLMWLTYYQSVVTVMFFVDDLSVLMICLTMMVGVMIFCVSKSGANLKLSFYSVIISILFFSSSSWLMMFIWFELSLIPVTLIVVVGGAYPERVAAAMYMFMFTFIPSSPLLMMILSMEVDGDQFIYETNIKSMSQILMMSVAFLAKVPLFFLHPWLPKAHVEAPLEGSMLLAGLMLKFGAYGLIRVWSAFSETWLSLIYVMGMFGSVMSLLVAISSDDMKMSVALSSVSHMNLCLANLATITQMSVEAGGIILVTHGLTSPLLFVVVTSVYMMVGTRSVLVSKGTCSGFNLTSSLVWVGWIHNISIPPMYSFTGELMEMSTILSVSWISWAIMGIYLTLTSVFSFINLGMLTHSPWKGDVKLGYSWNPVSVLSVVVTLILVLSFVFDGIK
uniref:NADH-ubiquinone oxidoreductase chain 4 n=1 Tax=Goniodes dissimilis TaxID=186210 RepID=A0A9E9J1X7_9NEOP|nr:NADH dehydrogenase subunit 4 [Goniodes dissimilis]